MNDFIKLAITLFSGGGIGAFLVFKLGNRKQDGVEFTTIVMEYKSLVEEYKKEVIELRHEVLELKEIAQMKKEEIINLRNQLIIFESSHVDIPIPIWLKDTSGVMLFVNDEYEKVILQPAGKTAEDYLGRTDIDVWGEEIGKQFRDNDAKIMRLKKPMEFKERWIGENGVIYEGTLIKYPRFLNNRTVIGIGGLIMHVKKIENV